MMRRSAARNVAGIPAHERTREAGYRLTKGEAKELKTSLDRYLRHGAIRIKTFSGFDSAVVSDLDTILPEQAIAESVSILADIQRVRGRGVRKQLGRLLIVVAKLAKSDGYSFRAVAESAAAMRA